MPIKTNDNGRLYQAPILITGAQVGPRLISASTRLDAFDLSEPREIISALSIHKYLTTALVGSNNDLTWFAISANQNVTVTYVDPGGVTASFAVEVVDLDITITLARAGSAIVTTASDIIAGVAAHAAASALVTATLATGNDGSGVVTAMPQAALAGPAGTNPTLDVELLTKLPGVPFYSINAKFAQKTAAGQTEGGYFTNLGTSGCYDITVGGAGAVFAFTIVTAFKP